MSFSSISHPYLTHQQVALWYQWDGWIFDLCLHGVKNDGIEHSYVSFMVTPCEL